MRLDRDADTHGTPFLDPPGKLVGAARKRVLPRLVRPVDTRQQGQAGGAQTGRELENVAEDGRGIRSLLRVGIVRSHPLEARPRDEEDVGRLEPA